MREDMRRSDEVVEAAPDIGRANSLEEGARQDACDLPAFSYPLNEQLLSQLAEAFFRVGSVIVKGVLSSAEVALLRAKTDECAANPATPAKHISYAGTTLILRRCHEMNPLFAALTTRESMLNIAQAVLGPEPRFNAMNVIRNEPGQAISYWHVDDLVEFPLPSSIPRFDPRMRMPVFWMTVQIALSDVDSLEHGATQFVPTSHYSGRPPQKENPIFEGRGPIPILCKAGDIYLTNHQCWHRGAPNRSDRTRYLMQIQFAQRWADARFKGLA
jgi:ectoine hydroxylase-related dioxygenase (phytanoyl-CoA dioxygenase family)